MSQESNVKTTWVTLALFFALGLLIGVFMMQRRVSSLV